MNVVATAGFLLECRCEFQFCTKHNMFSANARDIAVGDMNLCDLLKKQLKVRAHVCMAVPPSQLEENAAILYAWKAN